jgi:O-antigen ligase
LVDGTARARLGLAVILIFVVLLGGTDAGRYITAVRAATALIGAGFIALWLIRAPRSADRVDRLVLAALLLFLLACVFSDYPRFSFDAATSAMAFVAALFIARRVVADEASHHYAVTILGLAGTALAVIFVVLWASVWARWIGITGALPPLDLILPVGPYRHYHVVGMTVTLLMPAMIALSRRPVLWPIGLLGAAASAAVIVMSGSRTVWLALAVVGLITLLRYGAQAGGWIKEAAGSRARIATLVAVAAIVVLAATMPAGRLFGTSTIRLRFALWDATLDRWLADPLFGSGPGSFSASLTQSDFFTVYEGIGRHADNALVQVLAEAGLPGVLAVTLLGVAIVVGRRPRGGFAPIAGLGLFALMSLTDNPSDSAHLVAIAIVWFALAAPATLDERAGAITGWVRMPTVVGAVTVGIAVAVTLAASFMYDRAVGSGRAGDVPGVVEQLRTAAQLDPGNALYRRNLAGWLLAAGRSADAALEIGRAASLNPADATSWRIAAFAADAAGQPAVAVEFAGQAASIRAVDPQNALMVAWVARDDVVANDALETALRFQPSLSASAAWEAEFGGSMSGLIAAANAFWTETPDTARRWTSSRAWLAAMVGSPLDIADVGPFNAAASAVITCDVDEASRILGDVRGQPSTDSLLADILVARASGIDATHAIELAMLRSPALGFLASTDVPDRSPLIDPAEDQRLYSRLALPSPPIGPIFPTAESGLSAWLRDPATAADRGAPGSGLARCR